MSVATAIEVWRTCPATGENCAFNCVDDCVAAKVADPIANQVESLIDSEVLDRLDRAEATKGANLDKAFRAVKMVAITRLFQLFASRR